MREDPSPRAGGPPPDEGLEAVFLANLGTIDRIVAIQAARQAMEPDEADDFGGWVRMKLMEDDYAILGKYEGRASMGAYLSAVIANLLCDRRIQRWGKWRPSEAARRAGPVGVRLERLLRRDGVPFDTAVRILRSRNGCALDDRELARMAATFPERSRPRVDADAEAVQRAPGRDRADQRVLAEDAARREAGVMEVLEESLEVLDQEDRVILKLRFWEGLTVADISRALHVEQRPLYRRMERLLKRLRGSLEARGVTSIELGELLSEEAR